MPIIPSVPFTFSTGPGPEFFLADTSLSEPFKDYVFSQNDEVKITRNGDSETRTLDGRDPLDFVRDEINRIPASNVDELLEKMQQLLGVADFEFSGAVCFTDRQQKLFEQLKNAQSKAQVTSIIGELLNGKIG